MRSLSAIFRANKLLFFILFGILVVMADFVFVFTRADSFLWLNTFHSPGWDRFFTGFTYIGDGLFSVVLALILFFCGHRKMGYQMMMAFLLSGLVAQILKKIFPMPRPKALLNGDLYPYFIDGVTHSGYSSFPSGHTTSVFAMAVLLCLYTKSKGLQGVCILMALAVAYSRIYLGQHFLMDVWVGFIIGSLSAIWVYQRAALPRFLSRS